MQEFDLDTRLVSLPDADDSFPRVLSLIDDEPHFRLRIDVPPALCWFRGHFPGNPVLPGVVQLHWAVIVARAIFEFPDSPREIKRLKFKNIITPSRVLRLTVSRQAANEVQFEICDHDAQSSLGRLVFSEYAAC